MSLTCVKMSEDVWLTCLTHALSTETEEIMGLLLGDIQSENGKVTALIWGAAPQPRSDRKKDRVETNPEHLAAASVQAEIMTIETGRTTRVIGWYHSHPHITVIPSHVDVRTQAMYQLLDPGFIGLIFSCFSEDKEKKVGQIQVIAFQSSDGDPNTSPKTTNLVLKNQDSVIDLDTATTSVSKGKGRVSDFQSFFVNNAEASSSGKDGPSGKDSSAIETDPLDMSDDMQEAIRLSKLETSGSEYVRKEVRLLVLPTSSILELNSPLASFVALQRVLYEEERAAYHQSLQQTTRDGKVHPLTFIHNTSTYEATLCKLMEHCLSPVINVLQARLRENTIRLELLKEEAKVLEPQKRKGADTSGEGPSRRVRRSEKRS